MQPEGRPMEIPTFTSPEEELKYLRERVAEKEQQLSHEDEPVKKESVISQTITEYAKTPHVKLEEHLSIENPQYEKVLERMASIPHREKMRELYLTLAEKGVLSSLRMVQSLNNPHLEDDFHGVLVDYIKTGMVVPGLDKEKELSSLLHMTLYEVTLPFAGMQSGEKVLQFKDVIAEMERFYHGMLPLESAPVSRYGHFSLELVLSNFSNDIVFYIGVEEHMKDLFVKQILGAFPTAKIEEHLGDYNIFNEFGTAVGSYAEFTNNFVFPLGGVSGEQDPFATILNSFTKIERNGEGAAIQLVVYPDSDKVVNKIKHAIGQIKQGMPVARATDIPLSAGGVITKTFTEFFHTQVKNEKKDSAPDQKAIDAASDAVKLMDEKIVSPLLRVNLRVVVSAETKERAEAIRLSIESAFNQFTRPQSNAIKFNHTEKGRLTQLLRSFTFREVNNDEALIFNTNELATLYHLPMHITQKEAPQLKAVKSSSAPPPSDLPSEGTLLGVSQYRGETREIRLTKADRLRHLYTIGQTGTGKSVFLKNLVIQDILAGNGACFIDPHGSDVQDVLAAVPKERIQDVIYFDPSYTARPFALNMLEYDINHPEQKIFVVNEMLAIFKKLYSSSPESMGPAFEQYFRNATMLVMEDPETGNTLLDIPRVLADANFRNLKLSRCKNPIVVQFWRDIATKTSGESGLQNMIPYITNKFDVFISNDVMRPIIAQEKSSFNFRDIMDNKKILLVNLAKGKLGEMNANLIGLIIIGKFLMAAMSRVDSFGTKLPDFYLYVDEFQNIATPSISAILSEARKYGLSLNLAHQFIAQLPEDIKAAVFGNVGNMMVFRVGTEDAEFLESQFSPTFMATDIMKIENYNAYAKILINGKPVPPFNVKTLPTPDGRPEILEQLRELSYLKYGRDRKTVDDAILKKYLAQPTTAPAQPARPAVVQAPAAQAAPLPSNQFAQAFAKTSVQAVVPPPAPVMQVPAPINPPQSFVQVTPSAQAPVTQQHIEARVVPPSEVVVSPTASIATPPAAIQVTAPTPVQSAVVPPPVQQSETVVQPVVTVLPVQVVPTAPLTPIVPPTPIIETTAPVSIPLPTIASALPAVSAPVVSPIVEITQPKAVTAPPSPIPAPAQKLASENSFVMDVKIIPQISEVIAPLPTFATPAPQMAMEPTVVSPSQDTRPSLVIPQEEPVFPQIVVEPVRTALPTESIQVKSADPYGAIPEIQTPAVVAPAIAVPREVVSSPSPVVEVLPEVTTPTPVKIAPIIPATTRIDPYREAIE